MVLGTAPALTVQNTARFGGSIGGISIEGFKRRK
jgi:hypothetical protein